MSRTIHLGKGLTLPAHAFATNVVAALGMRGSGKSNVMTVAVEGLLAADVQVVILDYVGIHFGLRLLPNGKPSPFEIPVLGGRHGDIALVSGAGRQVAEALAASHSSAVLDISAFSKGERIKFAADFGEAFFHAKKSHEGPVFLLLEEAQRFVPQVMRFSDPALSRCLGAFEEIAEVGRNYGIGLGLISQRPQKINKDVFRRPIRMASSRRRLPRAPGSCARTRTVPMSSRSTSSHASLCRRSVSRPTTRRRTDR